MNLIETKQENTKDEGKIYKENEGKTTIEPRFVITKEETKLVQHIDIKLKKK